MHTHQFADALELYAISPRDGSRALRECAESDPESFAALAMKELASEGAPAAGRVLTTLLLTRDLAEDALGNTSLLNLSEAVTAWRRLLAANHGLEEKVLRDLALQHGHSAGQWAEREERLLELVSCSASATAMMPLLRELLKSTNARARSKAAKLLPRFAGRRELLNSLLHDEDARVRANAVEAAWGLPGDEARPLLELGAQDSNNRACGNAWVGLYRLREPAALAGIAGLIRHPDAAFRLTGLWAAKTVADPRLLGPVCAALSDPTPGIRRATVAAMATLQSVALRIRSAGRLNLRIAGVLKAGDAHTIELVLPLSPAPPDPFPFAILEDNQSVLRFDWEDLSGRLTLAVLVPAASNANEALMMKLATAKPEADRWAILPYATAEVKPSCTRTPSGFFPGAASLHRQRLARPLCCLPHTLLDAFESAAKLPAPRSCLVFLPGRFWPGCASAWEQLQSASPIPHLSLCAPPGAAPPPPLAEFVSGWRNAISEAEWPALARETGSALGQRARLRYTPLSSEAKEVVVQMWTPMGFGEDRYPMAPTGASEPRSSSLADTLPGPASRRQTPAP